jgi:hypothetical protein
MAPIILAGVLAIEQLTTVRAVSSPAGVRAGEPRVCEP